jgi:hypothetical protein
MSKDFELQGCVCQGCNTNYVTDINVPDDIWELIKPINKDYGAGLLCPVCITTRITNLDQFKGSTMNLVFTDHFSVLPTVDNTHFTVLGILGKARIFDIKVYEGATPKPLSIINRGIPFNKILIEEACEGSFCYILNKPNLKQLIDELSVIHNSMTD